MNLANLDPQLTGKSKEPEKKRGDANTGRINEREKGAIPAANG